MTWRRPAFFDWDQHTEQIAPGWRARFHANYVAARMSQPRGTAFCVADVIPPGTDPTDIVRRRRTAFLSRTVQEGPAEGLCYVHDDHTQSHFSQPRLDARRGIVICIWRADLWPCNRGKARVDLTDKDGMIEWACYGYGERTDDAYVFMHTNKEESKEDTA